MSLAHAMYNKRNKTNIQPTSRNRCNVDENLNENIDLSLPTETFYIKVPLAATKDLNDSYEFGTPVIYDHTTGRYRDPDLHQTIMVRWNFNNILNTYINGFTIVMPYPGDVTRFYNLIQDYLKKIRYVIEQGWQEQFDIDTRYKYMDKLCDEIYSNNGLAMYKEKVEKLRKIGANKSRLYQKDVRYRRRLPSEDVRIVAVDKEEMENINSSYDDINSVYTRNTPNTIYISKDRESLYVDPNKAKLLRTYKEKYNLRN